MSTHRSPRPSPLRLLRSRRLRAVLGLGVLAATASVGTLASWTDSVAVTGATFSSGTINLKVNGSDGPVSFTTMSLANMVPGNSTAGILTVSNSGTAPLTYTAVSTATNPDGKALSDSMVLKVTGDTATTGTAPTKSCAGTALAGTGAALNGDLVTTPRTLAAGASETLCVMAVLPTLAPSSVQGATTTATFTFNATSF